MNMNQVPEGKTVYILGRKYKRGEPLPAWALVEVPEISPEEEKVIFKQEETFFENKKKKKGKNSYGKSSTGGRD